MHVYARVHVHLCARACACARSRTCVRADGHTCVRARVYARGPRELKTAFGSVPLCRRVEFAPDVQKRQGYTRAATLTRSRHCCVRRPQGRPVSLRRWHACLASLSWRGFGCASAAESRPRSSSVAVCYQIGRRCVAFTRQPVRTHPRPHPPQAPVAALGLTFVTGTAAVFCFRSSTGEPGIAGSPRTTPVHPASTRMKTSAMTVGGVEFAGYPQPHPCPEKALIDEFTRGAGSRELTTAAKDVHRARISAYPGYALVGYDDRHVICVLQSDLCIRLTG
jgi:hypothetical protein